MPENIRVAREHHPALNLRYECRDIESWDSANLHDMVFMRGAIYYLSEVPVRVLQRIAASLVPGGEAFISFVNATCRARMINGVKRVMSRTPESIRPALRRGLAAAYWAAVRVVEGRAGARWWVIEGKMNTVFFPVQHLV